MANTKRDDGQLSLNELREAIELSSRAFGLLMQAESAMRDGRLDEAAQLYEGFAAAQRRVLARCETVAASGDREGIEATARTLVNGLFMQANALELLQRSDDAEARRNGALELSRKHLGAAGSAEAERSRAGALLAEARFNEALIALSTARDYFRQEGNALKLARTSLDLADVLQWLGDYSRALREVDEAAVVVEKAELRGGLGGLEDLVERQRISHELPYFRGLIAKFTGEYGTAERHLREALPAYRRLGVGVAVEYQIAAVMVRGDKVEEGLALAREIEPEMRSRAQLRSRLAAVLCVQGEALRALGKTEAAVAVLREAVRDMARYHNPDLAWRVAWQYGAALQAAGQSNEAMQAFDDAIEVVGQLRRAPLGYRLDSAYLADKMDLFHEAISAAAASQAVEKCAQHMDMIKSRALNVTLSVSRAEQHDGGPNDKLARELEDVTRRLDALEFQGFRDGWDAVLEERDALLQQRAQILERLRFSDPRWRSLSEPPSLDLSALTQQLAARDQAALSLFVRGNQIAAVLLTPRQSLTSTIQMADDTEAALLDYEDNLQLLDPDVALFDPSRLSLGFESLVPADLREPALAHSSLVIVPHGLLHLLPWAGLRYGDRHLFERCAVAISPSLAGILTLAGDPATQPKIALIGAPDYSATEGLIDLAEGRQEIAEIEKIYAARGSLVAAPLTDAGATEDNFWKIFATPDGASNILHIVCHGGAELDEPMSSGLYFADGKVDAGEISQRRTPFSEVVMSSCSSGWRPSRVGDVELVADDILGLPGAFLEAGARSILVSIPPAEDTATKEFMIRYHGLRAAGSEPLDAYRMTQLAMMAEEDLEPALWMGFTLYGCR
jgi:CHAT domain-containing protein